MLASEKHCNLLRKFLNYGRKKFGHGFQETAWVCRKCTLPSEGTLLKGNVVSVFSTHFSFADAAGVYVAA